MKKFNISLLGLVLLSMAARAQQRPLYSQYLQNQYMGNIAAAGIEDFTDIKAGYRKQWAGFDDAPRSLYITAHAPLGKAIETNGLPMRGRGSMLSSLPPAKRRLLRHAVGGSLMSDKMGPLSISSLQLSYNMHLPVGKESRLSFGLALGARYWALDESQLKLENPVDNALSLGNSILKPNMGLGIMYYAPKFFIGVSTDQTLNNKLSYGNVAAKPTGKQNIHLFATAGYRLNMGESFAVVPSVMMRYVKPAKSSVDLNLKLQYQNTVWAGVSYREGVAVAGLVGINLNDKFNLGYSYDFSAKNVNDFSARSHELVLGIMLPRPKQNTTRYIW